MIDSNNKLKSLSRALLESAQKILSEKKEDKSDLAKKAPPYDKVTHADVLVGRGVFSHDQVKAHKAKKGMKEDAELVVIHAPVLGDIHGELAEVLKRDPRDKTVHVACEGMKYILKSGQYRELDEAVKNPYAVGMAVAMKATGDTPPLKKSTINKAHEIAKKVDEEVEEVEDLDESKTHYMSGYNSEKSGKQRKHNPFKEGSSAAHHWAKGWEHSNDGKQPQKFVNEETEELDELSRKTLGSYIKKASNQAFYKGYSGGAMGARSNFYNDKEEEKAGEKNVHKAIKRVGGIRKATDKLTNEEVEDLDELSKSTLASYIKKASPSAIQKGIEHGTKKAERDEMDRVMNRHMSFSDKDKVHDTMKTTHKDVDKPREKALRRNQGIIRAVNRITKEEVELDELSRDTLRRYRMKSKSIGDNEKGDINYRSKGRELAGRKTYGGRINGVEKAKVMASEEVEFSQEEIDFIEATMSDLDEGRGRPPKEGSAAHKAKMQQDLSDMPALGIQVRKAASINKPVTFMNGQSKNLTNGHISRFNDHMDARKTSQEKAAFQKRAHSSHDEFVKAVSEPVPSRSKDTGEIVKYR